jgi:hypothetical protein
LLTLFAISAIVDISIFIIITITIAVGIQINIIKQCCLNLLIFSSIAIFVAIWLLFIIPCLN